MQHNCYASFWFEFATVRGGTIQGDFKTQRGYESVMCLCRAVTTWRLYCRE